LPFHTARLFLRSVTGLSNPSENTGTAAAEAVYCRLARPVEVPSGLSLILGAGGRPASQAQVTDFMQFAQLRGIDVSSLWVSERGGRILWAALPVINPGRSMLLFTPTSIFGPPIMAAAAQLLERLSDHFAHRDVHLAQVLVDPSEPAALKFFAEKGFARIAELIYLQGAPPRNAARAELPPELHWETYSPANHALLARAIVDTYRNSLDCPGLNGLRDIEDVITGHKATGDFDPQQWQILCQGDQPRGVLLLSRIPHSDAMELVYLGLSPEARGKGWGDLMMREAMYRVAADGRKKLTLAVDSINAPALKLYYRHGVGRLTSKVAMIRDLRRNLSTNPPQVR
jgi:mycothiol synthase